MFTFIKNKIGNLFGLTKEAIIEKLIKGYLGDYIKRLAGYQALTGFLLTSLQVAVILITDPTAAGIISIFIKSLSDISAGMATPEDVTLWATTLQTLFGLINKAIKKAKKVPQVPYELIERPKVPEIVRNEPRGN